MPGEGQLPTLYPPTVGPAPQNSLGTPGAHQSRQAGLSWWDSGRGPRWHWSRSAAGWSWRSPAAGCTWSGRTHVRTPVGCFPAAASQAQPLPLPLPGASPCLQGTPAAVGIGRTHAVPTGGVHGTRSDFHPNHLEAEAGARLSEAASPSQGTQPVRAMRGGGNGDSTLSRGNMGIRLPCTGR